MDPDAQFRRHSAMAYGCTKDLALDPDARDVFERLSKVPADLRHGRPQSARATMDKRKPRALNLEAVIADQHGRERDLALQIRHGPPADHRDGNAVEVGHGCEDIRR